MKWLDNVGARLAIWARNTLRSLRGRLAALLGLAFLPAGIIAMQAGLSEVSEREVSRQQSVGSQELAANAHLREELVQLREVARTVAANADIFAGNARLCNQTLESLHTRLPHVSILSVLDDQATVLCANQPAAIGQHAAAIPLIDEARASRRAVLGFVREPVMNAEPVFAAVARVEMGAGEQYVGVTRVAAPLLQRAVTQSRQSEAYTIMLDGEGRELASAGFRLAPDEWRVLAASLEGEPRAWPEGVFRVGRSWAIVTPIETDSLYVLHGWLPQRLTSWERAERVWALLLPILLWLGAIAVVWFVVEIYVARPLSEVERMARSLVRGLPPETEELRNAPSEISSLRRTLAAMAKTLTGREARLAEALMEERALLREVHHRVKNNLQMVVSMLSIQARAATDDNEARGLARAKDRVQMLAIAHARIYESGEVRDLALDQLIAEIARTLVSTRPDAARFRLTTVVDPVRADADRAVAFAFLAGEAISIALDAVPPGVDATLSVTLTGDESGDMQLEVTCPEAEGLTPQSPAAIRLIEAYARQLEAKLSAKPSHIRISVPHAPVE